jgi:integrase/recombinase XerD
MQKAGFAQKPYTSHTLRHSFATHMLDNGSNIHVIKQPVITSNTNTIAVATGIAQTAVD